MDEWSVFLHGSCIETVFYTDDCDEGYVYRDLIDRDGFDPEIRLVRSARLRQQRVVPHILTKEPTP